MQLNHSTTIVLISAVVAVMGCGRTENSNEGLGQIGSDSSVQTTASSTGESEPLSSPENADAAIDAFQSQALASIPNDLTSELQAFVVIAIRDREHLHARRLVCHACFERIDGTLMPTERESLILFGTIGDLSDHSGECWEITSFGGFGNSIEGYLDANTGKLLVLWIVPEG